MKYKQYYLARRHRSLGPAEFADAWREHSELASRFASTMGAHFEGVRQCVKIHDAHVPPAYAHDHDGCALLAMKSLDDLWAVRNHPRAVNEMKSDEERVFADYVDGWTTACETHDIAGSGDDPVFALIHFLARRPEVADDAFFAHIRYRTEAIAAAADAFGGRRVVLDRVIEKKEPPYDFGAVIEIWFDTQEIARLAAWNIMLRAILADLSDVADPARNVAMLARVNFEKHYVVDADGTARWDVRTHRAE